ncbi:hypothetical protein CISIN_1g025685mg [Citrus sinensis]|nr:hypothetical protein CISIN_1g025685mg [Citrus sinensis]
MLGIQPAHSVNIHLSSSMFTVPLMAASVITCSRRVLVQDDLEDDYSYEDEEDDLDEVYFRSSSSLRIGNRRWGDNGYVRAGRQEARPVCRPNSQDVGASSSREPKKKEVAKVTTGRRAKRALKREAADKAAASKHQQHLARLGRNLEARCSQ